MFSNQIRRVCSAALWPRALAGLVVCFALIGAARSNGVGTIVQALGEARIGSAAVTVGTTVRAGQALTTGANGYIYIKTIDGGFLILRPNSRAQVVAYDVDAAQPANSRFKIQLSQGVARNISGLAVKKSRENYRFNTPVAAIGVRGTDFTVFTNAQTTRVSVSSGGVVVSGFGVGCDPEGTGPCEGAAVRELFASQTGQVLQVNRGQALPQLLRGGSAAPDAAAPPRADEPPKTIAAGPSLTAEPSLAPLKLAGLDGRAQVTPPSAAPVPVVPTTLPALVAEVAPSPIVPVTLPAVPAISWGRWQPLADQAANISLGTLMAENKQVAMNSFFALGRSKTSLWQAPVAGTVNFSLQNSQALVRTDAAGAVSGATLENGKLSVDFVKGSFATQFDLQALGQRLPLQATGAVGSSGAFSNAGQYAVGSNMQVQGVLANDSSGLSAAYVFQSRINSSHVVSGITSWAK